MQLIRDIRHSVALMLSCTVVMNVSLEGTGGLLDRAEHDGAGDTLELSQIQ